MALTEAQRVDCRRWMGYPTLNPGQFDYVRSLTSWLDGVSLTVKLEALTDAEETVVVTTYLAKLATLETAVTDSASNLDTQAAGPWIANPREVAQRTALFRQVRRDLCDFLGFPPGPHLGSGGLTIIRG